MSSRSSSSSSSDHHVAASDDEKAVEIINDGNKKRYSMKCNLCDKKLSATSEKDVRRNLTRHIQTHNNIRRFPCTFCGQAFSTNQNLVRHQNSKHKQQLKEQRATSASLAGLNGGNANLDDDDDDAAENVPFASLMRSRAGSSSNTTAARSRGRFEDEDTKDGDDDNDDDDDDDDKNDGAKKPLLLMSRRRGGVKCGGASSVMFARRASPVVQFPTASANNGFGGDCFGLAPRTSSNPATPVTTTPTTVTAASQSVVFSSAPQQQQQQHQKFPCKFCDKSYTTANNLQFHVRQFHGMTTTGTASTAAAAAGTSTTPATVSPAPVRNEGGDAEQTGQKMKQQQQRKKGRDIEKECPHCNALLSSTTKLRRHIRHSCRMRQSLVAHQRNHVTGNHWDSDDDNDVFGHEDDANNNRDRDATCAQRRERRKRAKRSNSSGTGTVAALVVSGADPDDNSNNDDDDSCMKKRDVCLSFCAGDGVEQDAGDDAKTSESDESDEDENRAPTRRQRPDDHDDDDDDDDGDRSSHQHGLRAKKVRRRSSFRCPFFGCCGVYTSRQGLRAHIRLRHEGGIPQQSGSSRVVVVTQPDLSRIRFSANHDFGF